MNKELKVYPELSPRHTFSLELKNVHRVISLVFFNFPMIRLMILAMEVLICMFNMEYITVLVMYEMPDR